MYKVNATITYPGNSKKWLLEGIFVEKATEKQVTGSIIRDQCTNFLRRSLKVEKDVDRNLIDVKITYRKMPDDFLIVQDMK